MIPSEPAPFRLPSLSELLFGAFLLCGVLCLFLPLPSIMLDIAQTLNLCFALLVLMLALYVRRPGDVASLPAMLMLSVFGRLVISIQALRIYLVYHGWVYTQLMSFLEHLGEVTSRSMLSIGPANIAVAGLLALTLTCVTTIGLLSLGFFAPSTVAVREGLTADEQAAVMKDEAVLARLKACAILLGVESLLGLIGVLVFGGFSFQPIRNPTHLVFRLPTTLWQQGHMTIGTDSVSWFVVGLMELAVRTLPVMILGVALAVILMRTPCRDMPVSLSSHALAEAGRYPYAILLTAGTCMSLSCTGFLTGLPWWSFLLVAIPLAGWASTIFVAGDTLEAKRELEKVEGKVREMAERVTDKSD